MNMIIRSVKEEPWEILLHFIVKSVSTYQLYVCDKLGNKAAAIAMYI